jgi:iron complex transport system substrate-binding protein
MDRGFIFAILSIIAPVLLATGCAKGAPPPPTGATTAGGTTAVTGEKTSATATDSAAGKPLRILSLTPNVTEILFALGLGDKVVGRSTYCDFPPEATALPAVGDTMQLNMAAIIRLQPTLAFAVTRRDDLAKRLAGLGIRTVAVQSDHMDQLLAAIRTIGRETERSEAAEALVARIEADLATVRRRVEGLPHPRVLFAFPATIGTSRIMVAGRGTFVDELLRVAGAENAYPDQADWPSLGPEQVVALAPEIVLINTTGAAATDRPEAIRTAWAALTSVPAVARGRVHILTAAYLTIPGPRVGQAARLLADTIHPPAREEARP